MTVEDTPPPREKESPQEQVPIAIVQGAPFTELPRDLYIPPDALEVFLETFEGPLDLLLYLIKRQNLDILDIPIAEITRQYMHYVSLMKEFRLELAAEYLVMAAILAEIKSRMLLPRVTEEEEEEDPRAELVRRLQEYERFRIAARELDALPRVGREIFEANAAPPAVPVQKTYPKVSLEEIAQAFQEVLARADMFSHHLIRAEPLSVRERMANILTLLQSSELLEFMALFEPGEGRLGVVVALLALLELVRESLVELVQSTSYGRIQVRLLGACRT